MKIGIYRHYKGNLYEVIDIAKHSETLEELVLYKALYENLESKLWVRPKKMFFEVININGKEISRFKYEESIAQFLGDYESFFEKIMSNLSSKTINIDNYKISHLGYKAKTLKEYVRVRDGVKKYSSKFIENVHNGRPIAKLILKKPLKLGDNFSTPLIEVMPPKLGKQYPGGLEHLGVVLGENLDQFDEKYQKIITGKQNQSPSCKPSYIRFDDGLRVKFYKLSLRDHIEAEGVSLIDT